MNLSGAIWTDIPAFGEQRTGCDYQPRPGAYAVLLDAEQRIAIIRTPQGCYLPGGGSEPGESPEETLRREVREECGYGITDLRRLGEAIEFVFAEQEQQYFRKQGVFFIAALGACLPHETEGNHTLLWLTPRDAVRQLSHQSHAWVVRRVALTESQGG